jgi:tRNA pseudouridine55 synthase
VSVLVVDKPTGPTSFAVCKQVQHALARLWDTPARRLKVGHGGTLDPMASGVLPICVGEGTKLAPFLLDADKEYEATLRFGIETDTLDAEGQVVASASVEGVSAGTIEGALAAFRGPIVQVPPMFSALKRAGRPLYSYARAGETVERAPRHVQVHELVLLSFEGPEAVRLRVRCSKGTYVRALAADLGRALGSAAHLTGLRRIGSGPFRLAAALTLDEVLRRCDAREPLPLVSLGDALAHLPAVRVPEPIANALRRGQPLAWSALAEAPSSGSIRVLQTDGALVAVVEPGLAGAVKTLRAFHVQAPKLLDVT